MHRVSRRPATLCTIFSFLEENILSTSLQQIVAYFFLRFISKTSFIFSALSILGLKFFYFNPKRNFNIFKQYKAISSYITALFYCQNLKAIYVEQHEYLHIYLTPQQSFSKNITYKELLCSPNSTVVLHPICFNSSSKP